MLSIVNKRGLLCNESRALFLLEYKHELSLLKKLILITEKGIGGILPKDTWCYEGMLRNIIALLRAIEQQTYK